jgi:hypothetical protein
VLNDPRQAPFDPSTPVSIENDSRPGRAVDAGFIVAPAWRAMEVTCA